MFDDAGPGGLIPETAGSPARKTGSPAMRFDHLQQWLDWQNELHGQVIDLGLERVRAVAERLQINRIARQQVIVAGTNGKGSTVAAYEQWLSRQGYRVGCYTSPHLLHYNERIRFNGEMAGDREICQAFDAIDQARGDISLTYFEFGTLAALWLIKREMPDFALLEVGLGGRLDAVNIIDADLVHLTPIGLDHQAWLGNDRESIGFEKAGVLRESIPVIVADLDPPQSVMQQIKKLNCRASRIQSDFTIEQVAGRDFVWHCGDRKLPLHSPLYGEHQIQNLAAVVAGLDELLYLSRFDDNNIGNKFSGLQLAGRFQQVRSSPRVFVDVGHNEDASRVLAACLDDLRQPGDSVTVLLGMLEDKDCVAFASGLREVVDHWHLLSLQGERGLAALALKQRLAEVVAVEHCFESAAEALDALLISARDTDIILVTGSFFTVEALQQALGNQTL